MPGIDRDNELAKVIGRAVIDANYADRLVQDPAAAAAEIGAELDADQLRAVGDLSAIRLKSVGNIITEQLSELAFVDQQQQQQAQAD